MSRLVVDAVEGVTDIVEKMHRNIAGLSPIVGAAPSGRTRGVTGIVYRSVRGVTRAVGVGLDAALAQLAPLLRKPAHSEAREAALAALNGVIGDYLAASSNPLAITMSLRQHGQPLVLDRAIPASEPALRRQRLLVLVHGLCMNDLQWKREGHDHGAALALELGYTPLYLHYNSGRQIAANGRDFSDVLERLLAEWPVAVSELAIVCHSMGGLVARSACDDAAERKQKWLRRLKSLVFLGTPHHGAPLERAGNWVEMLLKISPYTAPLAKLGQIRSAGVKDLRYGRILDRSEDKERAGDRRAPKSRGSLPRGVQCFAIAATTQARPGSRSAHLRGDGLVPVASALGRHSDPALALAIPAAHQRVVFGCSHLGLLSSPEVHAAIREWLGAGRRNRPRLAGTTGTAPSSALERPALRD